MDNYGLELKPETEITVLQGDEDEASRPSTKPLTPDTDPRDTDHLCRELQSVDRQKWSLIKNMAVLCLAFLLNFTAVQSLRILQTYLHTDDLLSTASLAVFFSSLVVGCIFLPAPVISWLGCKWSIAASFMPYFLFIAANVYPLWTPVIITSVLLGLAASVLWPAMCTYLTEMAVAYAGLTGEASNDAIAKFFGVFFMIFQTTHIWGNLISGLLLHDKAELPVEEESSDVITCGAFSCAADRPVNRGHLVQPDSAKVYALCGAYMGLCLIAFITTTLCLSKQRPDDDDDDDEATIKTRCVERCPLFAATVRHWGHKKQLLLIPLTVYSGMQQAFITRDYARSYVECSAGLWVVGMSLVCFGVVNSISSLVVGYLLKYIGRPAILAFGAVLHCVTLVTLFSWQPRTDEQVVLYVIAGLWGAGDAVWQTTLNTLYGCLFTNSREAAFANLRLWQSLGFIVAFAWTNFLCIYVKVFVLLAVLACSMAGYFLTEALSRKRI